MDKLRDKIEDLDHSGGKSSGIKAEKYTKKHMSPKKLFIIATIVIATAIALINILG